MFNASPAQTANSPGKSVLLGKGLPVDLDTGSGFCFC